MTRPPPRSTLFPYTTLSDLFSPRAPRADERPRPRVGVVRGPHAGAADLARCARRPPQESRRHLADQDRKSTRLNSSHLGISYAVFCLKKKKMSSTQHPRTMH